MPENKTRPSDANVETYIAAISDEQKRDDCRSLASLLQQITGEPPILWGDSIIGFGQYHYEYDSGHQGDAPLIGFSPRKREFAIYIMSGFEPLQSHLNKLGKHKTGKSCLYVKRLSDINLKALAELMTESLKLTRMHHPE